MIKLVLSDMDGTLLPVRWKQVSQRAIDAIVACQEAGILVGPASGRDVHEMGTFFRGEGRCFETAVMVNGQVVYHEGKEVLRCGLDADALRRMTEIVREQSQSAVITYRDNGFADWVGCSHEGLGIFGQRAMLSGGERHDQLLDYPVTKAGVVCNLDAATRDQLQATIEAACPELDLYQTLPGWMDVVPHGWSKAEGVKALLEVMGIVPDEVLVFGDAENDLSLFDLVPNSCAVANASPQVKEAARWLVPASEEDGVAVTLEQLAHAARTGTRPAFMG